MHVGSSKQLWSMKTVGGVKFLHEHRIALAISMSIYETRSLLNINLIKFNIDLVSYSCIKKTFSSPVFQKSD